MSSRVLQIRFFFPSKVMFWDTLAYKTIKEKIELQRKLGQCLVVAFETIAIPLHFWQYSDTMCYIGKSKSGTTLPSHTVHGINQLNSHERRIQQYLCYPLHCCSKFVTSTTVAVVLRLHPVQHQKNLPLRGIFHLKRERIAVGGGKCFPDGITLCLLSLGQVIQRPFCCPPQFWTIILATTWASANCLALFSSSQTSEDRNRFCIT